MLAAALRQGHPLSSPQPRGDPKIAGFGCNHFGIDGIGLRGASSRG
jgi:hypothetical protein